MREIPVSIADFEHLISQDCVYVDKTKFIYNIVSSPNIYYFLSRPRRFGKSLTISTLQAIFEGKKELFKGLFFENTEWKWKKHPIIRLDFNEISNSDPESLKKNLGYILKEIASKYSVELKYQETEKIFNELTKTLFTKYNQKVVILIDEYDKPVISHLGLGEESLKIAKDNKKFLKVFYDNLKPLEPYLKTVFITGVSKFSKISIFSTLNNLIELDTIPDFADFLGYTEEELRDNFNEYFEVMAEKNNTTIENLYDEFQKYYNGFRFTKKEVSVYNPFSVGKALFSKEIDNYWFESGTPSFLINLMKEKKYDLTKLKYNKLMYNSLSSFDIEDLSIEPLLFQTGYLTIVDYNQDINMIILSYPNIEVEKGVTDHLMLSYTDKNVDLTLAAELSVFLLDNDYKNVIENLKAIFASIPYTIIPKYDKNAEVNHITGLTRFESYYHTIFFLTVSLLSNHKLGIYTEFITNKGRMDMAVAFDDKIIIFEFKVNQSADKAIKQISDKGYADRFKSTNKKIILVGIDFSSEDRNIKDYRVEEI